MKKIPVLITFDVDPAPNIDAGIIETLYLFRQLKISITYFFTANIAKKGIIAQILAEGHEVGCHGLNHDDLEELNKLDEKSQRQILVEAKNKLNQLIEQPVYSFRSPRVKTSATTLKILEELGYQIDSSVCSQRFDIFSSNWINWGWIFAPRLPYHPHQLSPYKKGNMKILEVPISSFGLAFVSTTLRIFGLSFMKCFFYLFYFESKLTGKPIVFLAHPHELIYGPRKPFSLQLLIPNKNWHITGFPLRIWLGRRYSGAMMKKIFLDFFSWISKRKKVKFMTMKEYVQTYYDKVN